MQASLRAHTQVLEALRETQFEQDRAPQAHGRVLEQVVGAVGTGPVADGLLTYCNHEHRHSTIGLHTPASVHFGTADLVRQQRAVTLAQA